jgi:hypothetical protein
MLRDAREYPSIPLRVRLSGNYLGLDINNELPRARRRHTTLLRPPVLAWQLDRGLRQTGPDGDIHIHLRQPVE